MQCGGMDLINKLPLGEFDFFPRHRILQLGDGSTGSAPNIEHMNILALLCDPFLHTDLLEFSQVFLPNSTSDSFRIN